MTVSTRFLARAGLIALAVGMVAVVSEARDRSEADRSWKSSWEARQAREAERRRVEQTRRAYEFRRAIAHARMRSEREVGAMRASSPPVAEAMCPVLSDPSARRAYERQARQWREQAFRRSTGLPLQTGLSVFAAAKESKPVFARSVSPAMASTVHAVSTAVLVSVAASASSSTESAHMVPLFPSASDARGRQGFARVINHSAEAGEVMIEAFDDEGASHGPLALSIGAGETVHFNSNDLEDGNADKGLTGSTGPGQGDWRLELSSDLDIEALSYIRTSDGFLTAMHDTVPVVDGRREATIFNPGSNRNQESLLRLVNPGEAEAVVTIAAVDDRGLSPGEGATVTIPAGASRTYTAAELESGSAAGLEGAIGDGTGKWRLELESEREIVAMSLLSSPTGHLTNLSTAPDNEQDGTRAVPLFPSSSDARGRQGFARVVNRSDESGEVMIEAFDDTDREHEVVTLSIGAGETRHFNSDDLELGNADKGLAGSTGAGEGDWRLELTSELDIEVLSYIRTTDGFLTAMHDLVPRSAKRHRVAVFNPGSNVDQQSALRLVNPGEEPAEVTISGFDDRDASPGSDVVVTVPAGGSASHAAVELESGSEEFEGALGNGSGKWRLTVNADRPIAAMSLLSSPTGHLTNLSTAPERGAGPVETASEAYEALISPIVQGKCVNCHVEGGKSGHTPLVFVRATDADHLAKNLSVFESYLEEVEDGADQILNKIQGALAHGGGVQVSAGTEQYGSFETFMELLGADVDRSAEVDLFAGVTLESPRRTLWRAAIVLAGKIPTAAEYAMVEGGTEHDLRRAIRGLMDCPEDEPRHHCGFHEFLIRGSNDRLLTDRAFPSAAADVIDVDRAYFVDFANLGYEQQINDPERFWNWYQKAQYSFARAPLELIAYLAETDGDYRKVLTASYIMANPLAARAYGATTEFNDPDDLQEFQPSEIVSYYGNDESKKTQDVDGRTRVLDPGELAVDYPHAGVLNTNGFLVRYPSTATNRNRARARWTYYHFLGDDIEKSEARTMDQQVLEDKNNPTMNNHACTVCHERMDPVAGTFQNYGDEGYYRDADGGLDSLDGHYKEDWVVAEVSSAITAETSAEAQTVRTSAWLQSGKDQVRLKPHFDPPMPEGSDMWWNMGIDVLRVLDGDGRIIQSIELEEVAEELDLCGSHDPGAEFYEGYFCIQEIAVDIPADGRYEFEVDIWVAGTRGVTDERPMMTMWVGGHREGDTWYRDMRRPGFDGELAPNADNSLQWLAQQIVADERFAKATVKFWWPAIMGTDVADPPEDEADASFAGRRLASNGQTAGVERLARGFRRGFHGGSPYNLKDLLVETMLSPWFRAETRTNDDAVRSVALAHAGARRLLTPEELLRKTAALTGYGWLRLKPHSWNTPGDILNWTGEYGLLYGGIDSDGITKRGRDFTAVMAGVAQRHAAAVSCPAVMKEFYLLPAEERRLLGGVNVWTTPVFEFRQVFEIEAASREEQETVKVDGELTAGDVTVTLAFINNEAGEDLVDRNLRLDRLDVRDANGELVATRELEEVAGATGCEWNAPWGDHFAFYCNGALDVAVEIPADGRYGFEVVAWADQNPNELAKLEVSVGTDTERSAGSRAIRAKLAELHEKLLGVEVDVSSADVQAAYDLFIDSWDRGRDSDRGGDFRSLRCDYGEDQHYFDGIADDIWREELDENGNPLGWDWERMGDFLQRETDMEDHHHVARTWVVVLAYLMTDYRYLHL